MNDASNNTLLATLMANFIFSAVNLNTVREQQKRIDVLKQDTQKCKQVDKQNIYNKGYRSAMNYCNSNFTLIKCMPE